MSAKHPITETQRSVLQWVSDGCPSGVFDDGRWKVSAYALRDRRLLTISKRGGGCRTCSRLGWRVRAGWCGRRLSTLTGTARAVNRP